MVLNESISAQYGLSEIEHMNYSDSVDSVSQTSVSIDSHSADNVLSDRVVLNEHMSTLYDCSSESNSTDRSFADSLDSASNQFDDILSISSSPCSNISSLSETINDINGHRPHLNHSDISLGSLNVCGLKSKLNSPEFVQLINQYHIFCVVETKLDVHDSIQIPNFTFFSKPRSQKVKRKSGGIDKYQTAQCAG